MIDTKGLVSTGGVGNLTTAGTALAIDTTNVTENIFGGFDTVSVITTHDTINDYSANDTINVRRWRGADDVCRFRRGRDVEPRHTDLRRHRCRLE